MFASAPIPEGTTVAEYTGEVQQVDGGAGCFVGVRCLNGCLQLEVDWVGVEIRWPTITFTEWTFMILEGLG